MLCFLWMARKHIVGNDLNTKFKYEYKNIFINEAQVLFNWNAIKVNISNLKH